MHYGMPLHEKFCPSWKKVKKTLSYITYNQYRQAYESVNEDSSLKSGFQQQLSEFLTSHFSM